MGDYNISEYEWNNDGKFSYEDSFLDYNELENLNQELIKIRFQLKNLNKKLSKAEKEKVILEVEYKTQFKKLVYNSDLETESKKKLFAEITLEETWARIQFLDSVIKELTRLSNLTRTELDIVQTLGHNLRKEMTF